MRDGEIGAIVSNFREIDRVAEWWICGRIIPRDARATRKLIHESVSRESRVDTRFKFAYMEYLLSLDICSPHFIYD